MKFQYLGTAAAEAIPAFFCACDNCRRSREAGGRAVRTRSQAIIDGQLLIDFPGDTYMHMTANRMDLLDVKACLITHAHHDHLCAADFSTIRPGFSHVPEGWHLDMAGSAKVRDKIADTLERVNFVDFKTVEAFETFTVCGYTVTALEARHDPNSGPLFYQISDGEKTVLYGHDTHYFCDSVWEYWEKNPPHFHMVSLDCTNACKPLTYIGHMGLEENATVRRKMLELGYADENTVFVCNHFSHNGTHVVYDDFVPLAAAEGFLVSYDGMIISL